MNFINFKNCFIEKDKKDVVKIESEAIYVKSTVATISEGRWFVDVDKLADNQPTNPIGTFRLINHFENNCVSFFEQFNSFLD